MNNNNKYSFIYDESNNKKSVNDYFLMTSNNSAGRGFGNLDVSNFIRNSDSSRSDKKIYKENLESQVTLEYKFNYVEDIPKPDPNDRIGISTRKQNQLNINIR